MTEFARLGMILSEDLVASLRAYRTEVKESCETLFQNMEAALSYLPCEVVGQEPYRIINEHSCSLRRDTSSLLATVNLVLADMKDFLDKHLEDAWSVGETKLISKAFLDQFGNHFEQIQKVVLHPAMHNSQVSNIVGASLAALQPLTAFSFTSIVDQVIDRIGLMVPTKPNKDGDPGIPACDQAGSHQIAAVLDAQFKVLLCELCEGTKDTRPRWYKPEALHLEYWKDFENRHPQYVAPVLPVSIFEQAKEEMRQLRELVPHTPTVGLAVMGANKLWQELCDTSPSQRKKKFESILEAQRRLKAKPQPDPPAPPAPPAVPKKDSKPNKPKGDGDPGDPEVKKEDKPQEPPPKPPGQPLKRPVIQIQPKAKDELEAKEEPKTKEEPKAKDEPDLPSKLAGKNKRSRFSKADPDEPPAKQPTQPQVVGTVTLEGEAMSKDKASEFDCNVSLKHIQAPDGSYIFKSDAVKGGEGEFDDDGEEENNDKVEIPGLNGDEDEDDAPDDHQPSKSDSKAEPDDEGDIRKEEPSKKKSHKDKKGSSKKRRSSHSQRSKVEEEEDPDESEVPFLQRLRNVHYKKFCEDTDEANYIKCILLGLGPGVIPTQAEIDQSELFQEQASDKTAPVADVSDAWMPILDEKLWLATEAPDKMKHKDGTAPLYKFKDLMRLVPNAAGAWTAKCAKPALVAVIPPTTTTPLEPAIGVEGLHNMAALRKATIPKLSRDPEKKAKQYSFCGYCGVRIKNFETDVNHIRHHLHLELLCGGCYGKAFIMNFQMSSHLKKCEAVLNVLGQLRDNYKQGGSQSRKR